MLEVCRMTQFFALLVFVGSFTSAVTEEAGLRDFADVSAADVTSPFGATIAARKAYGRQYHEAEVHHAEKQYESDMATLEVAKHQNLTAESLKRKNTAQLKAKLAASHVETADKKVRQMKVAHTSLENNHAQKMAKMLNKSFEDTVMPEMDQAEDVNNDHFAQVSEAKLALRLHNMETALVSAGQASAKRERNLEQEAIDADVAHVMIPKLQTAVASRKAKVLTENEEVRRDAARAALAAAESNSQLLMDDPELKQLRKHMSSLKTLVQERETQSDKQNKQYAEVTRLAGVKKTRIKEKIRQAEQLEARLAQYAHDNATKTQEMEKKTSVAIQDVERATAVAKPVDEALEAARETSDKADTALGKVTTEMKKEARKESDADKLVERAKRKKQDLNFAANNMTNEYQAANKVLFKAQLVEEEAKTNYEAMEGGLTATRAEVAQDVAMEAEAAKVLSHTQGEERSTEDQLKQLKMELFNVYTAVEEADSGEDTGAEAEAASWAKISQMTGKLSGDFANKLTTAVNQQRESGAEIQTLETVTITAAKRSSLEADKLANDTAVHLAQVKSLVMQEHGDVDKFKMKQTTLSTAAAQAESKVLEEQATVEAVEAKQALANTEKSNLENEIQAEKDNEANLEGEVEGETDKKKKERTKLLEAEAELKAAEAAAGIAQASADQFYLTGNHMSAAKRKDVISELANSKFRVHKAQEEIDSIKGKEVRLELDREKLLAKEKDTEHEISKTEGKLKTADQRSIQVATLRALSIKGQTGEQGKVNRMEDELDGIKNLLRQRQTSMLMAEDDEADADKESKSAREEADGAKSQLQNEEDSLNAALDAFSASNVTIDETHAQEQALSGINGGLLDSNNTLNYLTDLLAARAENLTQLEGVLASGKQQLSVLKSLYDGNVTVKAAAVAKYQAAEAKKEDLLIKMKEARAEADAEAEKQRELGKDKQVVDAELALVKGKMEQDQLLHRNAREKEFQAQNEAATAGKVVADAKISAAERIHNMAAFKKLMEDAESEYMSAMAKTNLVVANSKEQVEKIDEGVAAAKYTQEVAIADLKEAKQRKADTEAVFQERMGAISSAAQRLKGTKKDMVAVLNEIQATQDRHHQTLTKLKQEAVKSEYEQALTSLLGPDHVEAMSQQNMNQTTTALQQVVRKAEASASASMAAAKAKVAAASEAALAAINGNIDAAVAKHQYLESLPPNVRDKYMNGAKSHKGPTQAELDAQQKAEEDARMSEQTKLNDAELEKADRFINMGTRGAPQPDSPKQVLDVEEAEAAQADAAEEEEEAVTEDTADSDEEAVQEIPDDEVDTAASPEAAEEHAAVVEAEEALESQGPSQAFAEKLSDAELDDVSDVKAQ